MKSTLQIKKINQLILFVSLIAISFDADCQEYADKDFYLIDSLNLEEIATEDKLLLDSCLQVWHSSKNDTSRTNALISFFDKPYKHCELNTKYAEFLRSYISEKLIENYPTKIDQSLRENNAKALYNIAYCNLIQENIPTALKLFKQTEKEATPINFEPLLMQCYLNMGTCSFHSGNQQDALNYFDKSYKLASKIGDQQHSVLALNNLAGLYYHQNNIQKAKEVTLKVISLDSIMDNKNQYAAHLGNLASLYVAENNREKALNTLSKVLITQRELGATTDIMLTLTNIGDIQVAQGNYKEALACYNEALPLAEVSDNKLRTIATLRGIAKINLYTNQLKQAEIAGLKAVKLSQEFGYVLETQTSAKTLSKIYKAKKDYRKALEYNELYHLMKDSIVNEANKEAIYQQQYRLEYEVKAAADSVMQTEALKVKKAENDLQKSTIAAQNTQKWYLFGGLVLLALFGAVMFNRFRITKKQSDIIEEQRLDAVLQKETIEKAHGEILESITYAKRLQDAILPKQEEINSHIPENYVLFKPKETVSGDFYWFEHINDVNYIAVADCTGHGVPGALVSVVCANALDRSVNEFKLKEPAEILNKTRELVIQTFAKSGENIKDGMDITFCAITQDGKLMYSGANNPLWIVKKTEDVSEIDKVWKNNIIEDEFSLIETKANKQPIGLYERMIPFEQHTISLQKGDTIYLFTDGFPDQFGGEKGKKFKYKPFKNLLLDISQKPTAMQHQLILDCFNSWKGAEEQVDDVCIIGVRL